MRDRRDITDHERVQLLAAATEQAIKMVHCDQCRIRKVCTWFTDRQKWLCFRCANWTPRP